MVNSSSNEMEKNKDLEYDVAKYGSISSQLSSKPKSGPKVKYTSKQWMILINMAFGVFCSGACLSLQAPFFPAEAEKKGATPTEYGLIFGIYALAVFITSPIIGKLVSRISPKFILNIGFLTTGVTCIVFGILDVIEDSTAFVAAALVVRMVEGVGSASLQTASATICASQFLEDRGTTYAFLHTSFGVGLIAGPALGGVLYDIGGYGLPFFVVGGLICIESIVMFFVLPVVENGKVPEKGNFLKIWFHPTTIMYALSVFTSANYISFNSATLEPHLREFNLSGFLLGTIFALDGIVYGVASIVFGWLADRQCNSLYLSLLGSLTAVLSVLLIGPAPFFPLKTSLGLVLIAIVLKEIAVGAKLVNAFTGSLQSTINRGFPDDLSTYGFVSSMMTSSDSLGSFTGPCIGGYLLGEFGYRNASMSILILEAILIILLVISIFRNKLCITTKRISFTEESVVPTSNISSEKYLENASGSRNSN